MRTGEHSRRPLVALVAATGLLAGACGGDTGESDAGTAEVPADSVAKPADARSGDSLEDQVAPDDTATEASDSTVEPADDGSAIQGVLVSLLSPDFGLYDVARETGDSREISIDGVGYTDRERQPVMSGDTVFTLTYTPLEGQSYSHDVGVAAFDRATGEGTQIVVLGVDRTDDESADLTSYRILGAHDNTVWVESKPFAESDPALITYTGYDIATGNDVASLTDMAYRESGDLGECEVAVRHPIVDSAGGLLAAMDGWPAAVHPDSGEVIPLVVSCFDLQEPTLLSEVGVEDAEQFMVPQTDAPLAPETVETLAGIARLSIANDTFVEGDGSLWWVFNHNVATFVDDEQVSVLVGGVVRYDLATRRIADVFPLGDAVGTWLPEEELGGYTALSQLDLQYLDGSLWIMDWREDQPLRRIDPATGAVTAIEIAVGDGFDAVDANLIPNDPEAIWLDVTRKVVTETEDGGRSSRGEGFIDQIDVAANEVVMSVSQLDILGL